MEKPIGLLDDKEGSRIGSSLGKPLIPLQNAHIRVENVSSSMVR